ncbi:hypothetical protein MHL31_07505 [Lutibacter sp. A80]|uniref:hypothetical protein n=1 Tax=Lutibacter sp. A80 TaxID=2918453 RepID=UPI001F05414B|nr:hypothetical protein [Lutibacter sp. A80]UMB62030.1 hypothetical protein MHL31_07505 [Lutibacter sp. A80]
MTGNLEYLMSSLPNLSFQHEKDTQVKVTSLLKKYADSSVRESSLVVILNNEAAKFLSSNESRLFQEINLKNIHSNSFQISKYKVLSDFSSYVFNLKKEVEQLRLYRKSKDHQINQNKKNIQIIPGNPLEEEKQLIKFQWDRLELISAGHYADFEALISYKLKLMLLIRLWSFNQNKGFNIFESTIKTETYGG